MLIFVTEQSARALLKFLAFWGRIVHSFQAVNQVFPKI